MPRTPNYVTKKQMIEYVKSALTKAKGKSKMKKPMKAKEEKVGRSGQIVRLHPPLKVYYPSFGGTVSPSRNISIVISIFA